MSQPSLTNNDPYAYVDTVYERPARNLALSSHSQSEHAEDLRFMVKEGGLFEPTWRRDMARTTQPLSDLDAGIQKKRKGRGAKEPTDGREEEEEDIEALAAQLWHLIQAGLQARWDDQELHGGFVKRTPIEILESLRPLRLRGYQRHAVNRILAALLRGARGFLLAYGMGLGKTIITIGMSLVTVRH
jgi:SNF2 family DNA or RNA helicase